MILIFLNQCLKSTTVAYDHYFEDISGKFEHFWMDVELGLNHVNHERKRKRKERYEDIKVS